MLSSILSSLSLAQAFVLITESSNSLYDARGVIPFHESATQFTAFLGTIASEVQNVTLGFDKEFPYFAPAENEKFYLSNEMNTLVFDASLTSPVEQDTNGYLSADDFHFYVCKGYVRFDPYNYTSTGQYGISIFKDDDPKKPSDCDEIKIRVTS